MPLAREVLCRIVERAATLAERLDGRVTTIESGEVATASPKASARLARWCTLTSRGEPERFERRLRFDGLTPASALRALGEVRIGDETRLPEWALLLERAITAKMPREGGRVWSMASLLPFERVLLPFIDVARSEVATRAGDAVHRLSPAAGAQMERLLLRQLSSLAAPTLDAELAAGRAHDEGTLVELFVEYSSLARLVATRALHWADATAEILRRIDADATELAAKFNDGRALGTVMEAQSGLSDPHRQGRTVCILRFATGVTVVYKPRSLAMEHTFAEVVTWLSRRSKPPHLTALQALDRGTHGWMEFAAPAECSDEAEVDRYFERGGMLLCLMHTLGGSDMHHDNVLARGEYPLALDLEALAGPVIRPQGLDEDADPTPWSHVLESPLATGMVPQLRPRYDGTAESSGGLTLNGNDPHPTNVPSLRGEPVREEHPDAVLAGYRRMYRLLVTQRHELLSPNGPLASLGEGRVRIVFRGTRVYMAILERATAPRLMREGVDRSIEMEVLRQPFTRYEKRHRLWPALTAELDALEQLDVPIFEAPASGTTLLTSRGPISGYVRTSGRDRIMARIREMGITDLDRQLHYIRLAYSGHHQRRARVPHVTDVSREVSIAEAAHDAAELLMRSAVPAADGGATWQGMGGDAGAVPLHEIDLSLGGGRAGIAMFFAAAARAFGDERHRRVALATLAPLLGADRARRRAGSLSASRGDSGIAYALAKVGQLLQEHELLRVAERVAERISPARLAQENDATVWNGLSGALLCLLAVHDATGSAGALARAAMCGRRLLSSRVEDDVSSLRAWTTSDGDFASGFAYGASGVAHALLSLHERTGAPGLREAAEEAAELEATLFVPETGDWLDRSSLRGQSLRAQRRLPGWSRGAAGIGLSRVANLRVSDTPRVRTDIAAAIASAPKSVAGVPTRLAKPDHLWCGNLSQVELLMTAGIRMKCPELELRAHSLAQRVATRARRRGTYGDGTMESAFTPGLFDGLAGIGYELLRLHDPVGVPSVLLFE